MNNNPAGASVSPPPPAAAASKPVPQYTGRRNSALALARRASMADVLSKNARRTGSLGDVLLDGGNPSSTSLQVYLQSLIQRSSGGGGGGDEFSDGEDHHHGESSSSSSSSSAASSSSSSKKKGSSKRKRKEGSSSSKKSRSNGGSRRASLATSLPMGPSDEDGGSSSAIKTSTKRRKSSATLGGTSEPTSSASSSFSFGPDVGGSESLCEGGFLPPAGSASSHPAHMMQPHHPMAAMMHHQQQQMAQASSNQQQHAMMYQQLRQEHMSGPSPYHPRPMGPEHFTSFDECFDADLAILSTLSADEVELSSPSLPSVSPLPPSGMAVSPSPRPLGLAHSSPGLPTHHRQPSPHNHLVASPVAVSPHQMAVPISSPQLAMHHPHHPHHQHAQMPHVASPVLSNTAAAVVAGAVAAAAPALYSPSSSSSAPSPSSAMHRPVSPALLPSHHHYPHHSHQAAHGGSMPHQVAQVVTSPQLHAPFPSQQRAPSPAAIGMSSPSPQQQPPSPFMQPTSPVVTAHPHQHQQHQIASPVTQQHAQSVYHPHPSHHQHHQQQQAVPLMPSAGGHSYVPSPQASPLVSLPADDWSSLGSLLTNDASWHARSPLLSMHDQVERLVVASHPSSPFTLPPASPSTTTATAMMGSTSQSPFLRPLDVYRTQPQPSPSVLMPPPSPSATTAAGGSAPESVGTPTTLVPASPMSSFFDSWPDDLLTFDLEGHVN